MSSGLLGPADAGVAKMAGGSEHASEEERVRGQAAVGQQAWQAAAGQRRDHWGNKRSDPAAASAELTQVSKVLSLTLF